MNQSVIKIQEASVLHEIIFGKRSTYLNAIDFSQIPEAVSVFKEPENAAGISIQNSHWGAANDYITPKDFADYQRQIRYRTLERVTQSGKPIEEKLAILDELRKMPETSIFLGSRNILENVIEEMSSTFEKDILSTGITEIDKLIGGIFKTTVMVISGETGLGKSQIAGNIAYRVLAKGGKVAYYDLENDPNDFMRRRIAAELSKELKKYVPHSDLRVKEWWARYEPNVSIIAGKVADDIHGLSLYNNNKIPTIQDFVRSMEEVSGVDLVVIDHLHYFQMEEDRLESEQIGKIMRQLRVLTKNKRIPIVIVAHVRKKQGKGSIGNDDLFGSSNIPKEAETVIMLSKDGDNLRIALTKNRNTGITRSWICNSRKNYEFDDLREEFSSLKEVEF